MVGVCVALSAGLVLALSVGGKSLLRKVVVRIRLVKRDLTMDRQGWIDSVLSEHSLLEAKPILAFPVDSL